MLQRVKGSEQLAESIEAFMTIGSESNRLVHDDSGRGLFAPISETTPQRFVLRQRGMLYGTMRTRQKLFVPGTRVFVNNRMPLRVMLSVSWPTQLTGGVRLKVRSRA